MRKYQILVSSVIMQMCLGATYSWSVYVMPIREMTQLTQGSVQLPFTMFYICFPAVTILAGGLLRRLGPKKSSIIGGIFFGGGWLLAGFGSYDFIFSMLGIGLMAGVGVGFAYIVPIAVCVQWFPNHKGLVTGIAVAGFGGGAALVSQIGGALIEQYGYSPFETFQVFGLAFLACVTLAGLTMSFPAAQKKVELNFKTIKKTIKSKIFLILYFAMFVGLAAGFAVNANLKELSPLESVQLGILAVSLFAVANALGRVCWGWLFDRIESFVSIPINLLSQSVLLIFSPLILTSEEGYLVFSFLAGFNYGGVLVLYASSIARLYGGNKVGPLYGWLFSSNIPAAISPIFAGFAFDYSGVFTYAFWVLGGLLLCASIAAIRFLMMDKPHTSLEEPIVEQGVSE